MKKICYTFSPKENTHNAQKHISIRLICMLDDLNFWMLGSRNISQISQGRIIIHSWLSSYVNLCNTYLDVTNYEVYLRNNIINNIFFRIRGKTQCSLKMAKIIYIHTIT